MRTKDNQVQTITMPFEGEVITNDEQMTVKQEVKIIPTSSRVIHKKYRLKN